MRDGVKPKVLSMCTIVYCLCLHTYILPSICSSICPACNASSEGDWGILGSGWVGYSPSSREEWHHHILYCPAARHTWCCCPEWDSCSAGPNLWLTSVTCSQPHQFEATHQICVESCSHNLCWNRSLFNWHYGSFPYIAVEWVVMCFLISINFILHIQLQHVMLFINFEVFFSPAFSLHFIQPQGLYLTWVMKRAPALQSTSPGSHPRNLMVTL